MRKFLLILIIGFAFFACDDKDDTHTHEWEWKVTTPATQTADGLETETCKTCGAESGNTRPIAKLNVTETHTIVLDTWQVTFDIKFEKLPSDPMPEYVNYLAGRFLTMDGVLDETPGWDAMEHLVSKGNRFTVRIKYTDNSFEGMNWNTATQEFEIHHNWISVPDVNLSAAMIRTAFNAVE